MANTPRLDTVSPKRQRIAELARQAPEMVFTSLAHHIDRDVLHAAYVATRKDGAVGLDGQTADDYAANLEANLQSLLDRFKSGQYVAPPVRRVHIPKGDGRTTRPIGIPTFEDKVLQRAVVLVLESVYEQNFRDCSFGFRPGRSAHQALQHLWEQTMLMGGGWVIDLDIQGFFDALDHRHLRRFLDQRIRDGVLRRAIDKWLIRTARFDGGWTMEAAIPFKSLRYRPGREQIWGVNIIRIVQWKNERSSLTALPAARGLAGQFMASFSATLVGLEAPVGGSRTLELKPYAISEVAGTQSGRPTLSNDFTGDVGFDVKYGVTENLVGDLTVNTDFAQVEADTQQVNLTRFSLFFPEKREFFLENQGTFAFGGARIAGARGGGTDVPVLFYSREIGLDRGQEVPMDIGGRLTGRVGRFSVGFMNIQTGGVPDIGARSTNFTIARIRRDILRRSNVGLLFTGRSVSKDGEGSSETYGIDGVFSFYDNLNINTYWSKTQTPGLTGDDVSYRGQLDYNSDRYGVQVERLVVGGDFRPEVGFLRRDDFDRRFGLFRFSPRPERIDSIRKLTFQGQAAYVLDRAGLLETRENQIQVGVELENSDAFNLTHTDSYEFLKQPFGIAPGVTIPIGGYGFQDTQVSYTIGPQRMLAGMVSLQHGSFFSGNKTTVGFSRGRLELTLQFSLEPGVSYNRVDLPEGLFTANLVTTRTTYTVTPLMFVSALLQYNSSSDSLSTNVRLRWEYQPGSELFVVYNEQRDTLAPRRLPELKNRAFVVKINRLFRF